MLATLKYGDPVEVVSKKEGWLDVKAGGKRGFVHETAVTERKLPKVAPGSEGTQSTTVSRDEVALAGKGFNPQVENEYRAGKPELNDEFALVDAMERRAVAPAELEQFMDAGKLGDGRRP